MKFRPTIGADLSGSIGGITASRNRGGAYFRNRVVPVNPSSPLQLASRARFTSAVNDWQDLTEAERARWADYAANVPVKDRIGQDIFLTGQQWYIGSHTLAVQAGATPVDAAPADFNRGATDPTLAYAASAASGELTVTFDNAEAWANEDDGQLVIFASRPTNASVNFFKGPYQLAGTVDGDATTAPTSPATLTLPFPPAAGQKVHVRAVIRRADGRYTSGFRGVCTVGA